MNTRSGRVFFLLPLVVALLLLAGGQDVNAQSTEWRAEYWDNPDLLGANPKLVQMEPAINHRWGTGSPAWLLPADNFSARWSKTDYFSGGPYRFTATMDDGMVVYLDGKIIIDSWTPSEEHTMTRDVQVTPGYHTLVVEYFEAGGLATAVFDYAPAAGGNFYPNWRGEYFNNKDLLGEPVMVRDDRYLNHDWGYGSPAPGIVNEDEWSARWTRTLDLPAGNYRVHIASDDGARVFLNNRLVYSRWTGGGAVTETFNYGHAGGALPVRVEYFDDLRQASLTLGYEQLSGAPVTPVQPIVPVEPGEPVQPVTPPEATCPLPEGLTAVVKSNYLNVRSGPSPDSPVVGTLAKCDRVSLTGYVAPDYIWVQLFNPVPGYSEQYWTSSKYLNLAVPVESLTVWR